MGSTFAGLVMQVQREVLVVVEVVVVVFVVVVVAVELLNPAWIFWCSRVTHLFQNPEL